MQAPPVPPFAFTCPKCGSPATPRPDVQTCGSCGCRFTLHAGRLVDPSVVPPQLGYASTIRVKSGGMVLMKMGEVTPYGISEGTLDPVTGMIPIEQSGILYGDVYSIAVWRTLDVVRLVLALLVPTPIALGLFWVALNVPFFVFFAAFFALLTGWVLYLAVGVRANHMRVVGAYRMVTIRFDGPIWRRRSFHEEAFRRAGIQPPAIP
jgi:hypothetical protein